MDMIDQWTVNGEKFYLPRWSFRVTLTSDAGLRPENDGEWAKPEDIAAWKRNDWCYVVVTVTPVDRLGRVWEANAYSGGAVVWGTLGDGTVIDRERIEKDQLPILIEGCWSTVHK